VYIIGGGPSLTPEAIQSVKGRRAIAINMSYLSAPWADLLFFADQRWWDREFKERKDKLLGFPGRIVTTCTSVAHPKLSYVKRSLPANAGISRSPDTVSFERTSVHGAMNLCYHLGAKRIVLLGVDNRDAPNGRIHHHDEYPWVRRQESWGIKGEQFGLAARDLAKLGVEVINCSPVSTLTYWPIRPLADVLKEADQ
jgi:hypothetical protein